MADSLIRERAGWSRPDCTTREQRGTIMEPTTENQNQTENSEQIETVKPVRAHGLTSRSEMMIGNVRIARKFNPVDTVKNTDPSTMPLESIDVTIRTKIGKVWYLVEARINSRYSSKIYECITIGTEITKMEVQENSDGTKKIVPVAREFKMNRDGLYAVIYSDSITSYFDYQTIESVDVVDVFALARLLNVDNKVATEMIKMIDQIKTYHEGN